MVAFGSVAVVDVVLYHLVSGRVVLFTLRGCTSMLILLLESRRSSDTVERKR